MRLPWPILPVFLFGCAIFPTAKTYTPVIVEITDRSRYELDLAACHSVADNYGPGFDTGQIAQQTLEGATSNAAYGVINPLVPAAGAAGGAASATIADLGVTGQAGIKVLVKCLEEKSRRDQSFIIADPSG